MKGAFLATDEHGFSRIIAEKRDGITLRDLVLTANEHGRRDRVNGLMEPIGPMGLMGPMGSMGPADLRFCRH